MINKIKLYIKKRRYKKFTEYYRCNPVKFCEDYFGIELFEYQKKILNYAYKSNISCTKDDINEMNKLINDRIAKDSNKVWKGDINHND